MTADAMHQDHKTRAAAWFGWKPSGAHPCPLALAGHRCRLHTAPTCLCNTRRLLDHPRRWIDRDGNPVLTAEPYDAHGEELAEPSRTSRWSPSRSIFWLRHARRPLQIWDIPPRRKTTNVRSHCDRSA